MTSTITAIIDHGKRYYDTTHVDIHARYKSWEHCYTAFSAYKGRNISDADLDYLCLHLAFYLASWGMYRGSSFLLQKDYRVHALAIRKLMQERYLHLWAITCEDYLNTPESIFDLMSLTNELKVIYNDIRTSANTHTGKSEPVLSISDTLITKILLGTLGCVPAYDRFFIRGILTNRVASSIYNERSIINLSSFYVKNREAFEAWRIEISRENIEYPQMKILDMCFWQAGYNQV